MALLNSIFGLLEHLESAYLTVHQNRCVMVRNRNATCLKCARACTSGCLSYSDNELLVSPEKCIGCGTCATVCPTGALEAKNPDDAGLLQELLLATRAAGASCAIACVDVLKEAGDTYHRDKVVGVACLGRIEESALLALVDAGAKRIDLIRGECERCDYRTGLKTAQAVCATTATLLRAWRSDAKVHIAAELPASLLLLESKGYNEDRRAFFSAMKDEIKNIAGRAAVYAAQEQLEKEKTTSPERVKVMPDGTLPHFLPDRRRHLLRCLLSLGEPVDTLIETRLWGHMIIDVELCSSCQMCVTFCPTGAISKYVEKDGPSGVVFRPRDCVKCRCCADICPEHAITISEEVFAVDLLSGAEESYAMTPAKNPPGNPRAIVNAMKALLKSDQVYER